MLKIKKILLWLSLLPFLVTCDWLSKKTSSPEETNNDDQKQISIIDDEEIDNENEIIINEIKNDFNYLDIENDFVYNQEIRYQHYKKLINKLLSYQEKYYKRTTLKPVLASYLKTVQEKRQWLKNNSSFINYLCC